MYTICGDAIPGVCFLQISQQKEEVKKKLRERRVPSSAFGRAAGFAGMGASLVFGSMRDSVSSCRTYPFTCVLFHTTPTLTLMCGSMRGSVLPYACILSLHIHSMYCHVL